MDIAGLYDHDDKAIVNEVLNLITTIGCIFSIVCLFLASLVFVCFRLEFFYFRKNNFMKDKEGFYSEI